MWRGAGRSVLLTLLFITCFSVVSSAKIKSRVEPHEGYEDTLITFHYNITSINGTDVLRIYLMKCNITDSGIKGCSGSDARLSNRVLELSVNESLLIGSVKLDLKKNSTLLSPGLFRICVNLLHGGQNCDKDNYFLLKEREVITETRTKEVIKTEIKEVPIIKEVNVTKYVYVQPEKPLQLSITYIPSEFIAGEDFFVGVNVTNPTNQTKIFELYSYVYNKSTPYTTSWNANKQVIELGAYASINLTLKNKLREDVKGLAWLKVRAKLNNTNYDAKKLIKITEKQYCELIINTHEEHLNNTRRITLLLNNTGNIPCNTSIIFLTLNDSITQERVIQPNGTTRLSLNLTRLPASINVFHQDKLVYSKNINTLQEENRVTGRFFQIPTQLVNAINSLPLTQITTYVILSSISLVGLHLLLKKF